MVRKFVFLIALVALMVPAMSAQSNTKIIDFETAMTTLGLKIGTYSDKSMNGTSVIKVKSTDGPAGRGKAVDLFGNITTDYPYGFAGLHVPLTKNDADVMDVSGFKGLRFAARGDGQSYMVVMITQGVKDFDDFSYLFKPTAEWSTLDIPFTKLKQLGFGAPMRWSGKDLKAIRFQIQTFGPPILHYEFAVDDVVFY
jgi:hypothetical protein